MFELNTSNGVVKIFAETIESEAISQIMNMANSPLGEGANIRIMPDAHAGAGCTIGTTMKIKDKVCPNLVGVDIGCGVDLISTNTDFSKRLEELDNIIHTEIPSGMSVYGDEVTNDKRFAKMFCWEKLSDVTKATAIRSLGTLGGGNHFIEAYEDGFISVHSGSRNIGYKVAEYYQNLAIQRYKQKENCDYKSLIQSIPPKERETFIKTYNKPTLNTSLAWLEGEDMEAYLHDIEIMQQFAYHNRIQILATITKHMRCDISEIVATSIHNYIDTNNMILRKGAISANNGERLVIPLNMRDGVLICKGKGNEDWNCSAPHGAGRLYSRSKAKELFSVEEYEKSMKGIYTTCISQSTLD